jgi:adenine-specific DNA-methyltransferase
MFRYIGSKSSTSANISSLINDLIGVGTVADAFGGLGTIGAELRERGHHVTTCDVLNFPHAFQIARIEGKARLPFVELSHQTGLSSMDEIRHKLNSSTASRSWIVQEYSQQRKFFTYANALAIAGAWHQIKRWNDAQLLNRRETALLVASLLNSMDAVANTAGTYYAYLKKFHRKALKPFKFEWLPVTEGRYVGKALHGDALSCLRGKNFDVLYLDPPYNDRNYASYYHLPESMSMLKRPQTNPDRMSGVPKGVHPGSACIRDGMTIDYIEKLASEVGWKWLIVHYCDGALIPLPTIRKRLSQFGRVHEQTLPALGYTTSKIVRTIDHHVFVVSAATHISSRAFCHA